MLSQLRTILAAEAEARRTVDAARAAAAAEVARAEEAARAVVAEARALRDAVASAVEARLVDEAEAEAQRFEVAAQKRIAELGERAKLRLDLAVAAIAERVLASEEGDGSAAGALSRKGRADG
jgi:hypothetical protein